MARTARIPLERLAYSLAWGARRLSPDGALYVESGTLVPPAGRGKGWITLAVRIDDPSLDAGTLARVFEPEAAPPGALALEALRRRLRSEDGDLSISVESGVGAVLTAFLPRRGRRPARRRSAPRVSPRTVG